MTTSTTNMLRALGPSSSDKSADIGDLQETPPLDAPQPHLALTPAPSMDAVLNYCLGQTKSKDQTPT